MIDLLNPVDLHVGARLRATRDSRNFELWQLATAIEIPASRLLEYETGKTRCEPQHLLAMAETLRVRSTLFFDGLLEKPTRANFVVANAMPESKFAANDNLASTEQKLRQ
jgi:transcriptional regulator with XRE-family HTH domain